MDYKAEYTKNIGLMKEAIALIPDDNHNKELLNNRLSGLEKAAGGRENEGVSETEWCFLNLLSNSYMRQAIFTVYDLNLMNPGLEKNWREVPLPVSEASKAWDETTKKLEAEREEIMKTAREFEEKRATLGEFQSVATGRSKDFKEAAAKSKAYAEKAKKAGQAA